MDLLTYFSQSEHATCPQRVLYHHKVGFIRADLLEYRKLEGSVNQTSPVPLHPCKAQPFFQPCSQSRSFLSLFESQQTLCRSLQVLMKSLSFHHPQEQAVCSLLSSATSQSPARIGLSGRCGPAPCSEERLAPSTAPCLQDGATLPSQPAAAARRQRAGSSCLPAYTSFKHRDSSRLQTKKMKKMPSIIVQRTNPK